MFKILVLQPDNWHFLQEDGRDIEYIDERQAIEFVMAVKDCFIHKIEVKSV